MFLHTRLSLLIKVDYHGCIVVIQYFLRNFDAYSHIYSTLDFSWIKLLSKVLCRNISWCGRGFRLSCLCILSSYCGKKYFWVSVIPVVKSLLFIIFTEILHQLFKNYILRKFKCNLSKVIYSFIDNFQIPQLNNVVVEI